MGRKLLTFRHSETTYDRPNQEWSCGRECEGMSCALGPDARGRCRAGHCTEGELPRKSGECIPAKGEYNKFTGETANADRWFCTRTDDRGGPCDDGPLPDGSCCRTVAPCRPLSSLRRNRRLLSICIVGVTVATILLFVAKTPALPSHGLNPGPLSHAHSTASISCSDCHTSPSFSLALDDFHARARGDAMLCLKCHDEIGDPGDGTSLAAHTLPGDHLKLLTQKAQATRTDATAPSILKLTSLVAKANKELACATCHSEHHGKDANIKAISNNRCQTCHTNQFHSFGNGHPEFTSYPYRRKTRIFFDHETHFREYFNNAEVKQHAMNSCSQCHSEAEDGQMMTTGSFEKTCAACHDADTRFDQWELLAFPKVDTRNLKDQFGADDFEKLTAWKSATAREITPLLKFLLESDSGGGPGSRAEAIGVLRASEDGFQLRRHRNVPDAQMKAAATVASDLVNSIYGQDDGVFKQRLVVSEWLKGAAPAERARLGSNLADIFAQLRVAAQAQRDGEGQAVISTTDSGGVFAYEKATGSLSYKPGGHADPFLKAALDVGAAQASASDNAAALFGSASDYMSGFDSTAAGKCLKCHTVDRRQDGVLSVNWNPGGPESGGRPITHFKHRSHVRLPELIRPNPISENEACASCHVLGKTELWVKDYRETFSGGTLNPHHFRSGFADLSINSCTSCHTPEKAGDGCLQCHQYHATPSPLEPNFEDLLNGKAKPGPALEPAAGETVDDPGSSEPLTPDGGDSLIPDEGGDSLIPDEASDSLIPDEGGDSLIPDEGGDSLIPDDGGDLLIPDEGGDPLIPNEGGDSLIPDEGGESLVPGGEGDRTAPS